MQVPNLNQIDASNVFGLMLQCHLNGFPEMAATIADNHKFSPDGPFEPVFAPDLDKLAIFHRPSLVVMEINAPPLALPVPAFQAYAQAITCRMGLTTIPSEFRLSATLKQATAQAAFDEELDKWTTALDERVDLLGRREGIHSDDNEEGKSEDDVMDESEDGVTDGSEDDVMEEAGAPGS
ncbi:hypothetical protein FRC01_013785 [Tulasnella sp. 417]|nr:hypothetical protein FRC01_013785 [Tulasnella sp. 417]